MPIIKGILMVLGSVVGILIVLDLPRSLRVIWSELKAQQPQRQQKKV